MLDHLGTETNFPVCLLCLLKEAARGSSISHRGGVLTLAGVNFLSSFFPRHHPPWWTRHQSHLRTRTSETELTLMQIKRSPGTKTAPCPSANKKRDQDTTQHMSQPNSKQMRNRKKKHIPKIQTFFYNCNPSNMHPISKFN